MAQLIDLEAELAAGQEEAKHDLHDAAIGSKSSALQAALQTSTQRKNKTHPKLVAKVKRAIKMMDQGEHAGSARLLLQVLDVDQDFAIANIALAMALERLGRLSTALTFYERAWKLDPKNPDLYHNLALIAWKLDMLEAAEKFTRLECQIAPHKPMGFVNLGGVLRDQSKFEDAIEVIRAAIYQHPEDSDLWNSMGTVLLESGDPEQAVIFYQEALRLKPGFARAHHNLAYAYELIGDMEDAIFHFKEALKNPANTSDKVTMTHGLSLAQLSVGELDEGWRNYASRLDPGYSNMTHFLVNQPRWDGFDPDEIYNKHLLLIGEQGIGDEIMYLSALNDLFALMGPEGKISIACQQRLIPLFSRSFPQLHLITPHHTRNIEGQSRRIVIGLDKEFSPDLWAPMANMMGCLRNDKTKFPTQGGHLTPDPEKVKYFKSQLEQLGPGLKVGFCWKSKLMNAKRSKYFSPFSAWKTVLQLPNTVWINLQYGEIEDDIKHCYDDLGVKIHELEGLDVMNQLDDLTALGAALDTAVGPMNASLALVAGAGTPVCVAAGQKHVWAQFGTENLPWLPSAKLFNSKKFADWPLVMNNIRTELERHLATFQDAS